MDRTGLRRNILLLATSMLLIVSCAPRPAWVTGMLKRPVCLAPCWENITPGVTTRAELSGILEQNHRYFDIVSSTGDPWGPVISWCEGGSPCGPGLLSAFSSFDSGGIVQEINLEPGIALQLKDVIPLYGAPDKVAFSDTISDPGNVGVALLYPKNGLVLEFYAKNQGSIARPVVNFQPDLAIFRIIFTIPGLDYYYSKNIIAKTLEQFAWKGYSIYP
jgi:hypothetical protein